MEYIDTSTGRGGDYSVFYSDYKTATVEMIPILLRAQKKTINQIHG